MKILTISNKYTYNQAFLSKKKTQAKKQRHEIKRISQIHRFYPELTKEYSQLGIDKQNLQAFFSLKISPTEIRKYYEANIRRDDIPALYKEGITPEIVKSYLDAGIEKSRLSITIPNLCRNNISPEILKQYIEAGVNSYSDMITYHGKGITPAVCKEYKEAGFEFQIDTLVELNISPKVAKVFFEQNIDIFDMRTLRYATNFKELDAKKRIMLYGTIIALSNKQKEALNKEFGYNLDEIANSLKITIIPTKVSDNDFKKGFEGFFANNNPELENTLKDAHFEQYGLEGLPLKYSRKDFISNLNSLIQNLDSAQQEKIFEKLDIMPIKENDVLIGYDGIINPDFEEGNELEKEIKNLVNNFIRKNEIQTENEPLNNALNSLIKAYPEFINVIQKRQHKGQKFSIDIHILLSLSNVLNDERFSSLPDIDKTCLKLAMVFHDISKPELIKDPNHPLESAEFCANILQKNDKLNPKLKSRVHELIKNHHWLEEYNKKNIDSYQIACYFRTKENYELAKIMTKADIEAIGLADTSYFLSVLSQERQQPIADSLDDFYSQGQLFFTNQIINKTDKPIIYGKNKILGTIPKEKITINGNEYEIKIADFTNLPQDADLSELFGFEPGTTIDNLRLFVHMINKYSYSSYGSKLNLKKNLNTLYILQQTAFPSTLCASYISLKDKHTYYNCKFGVSLSASNSNIVDANSRNIGSGYQKDMSYFLTRKRKQEGSFLIPTEIKKELNLTTKEYIELYGKIQNYSLLSQIKDDAVFKIGQRVFSGEEIKKAIKNADDSIITKGERQNNEVNLYNSKINAIVAKVNSIYEVPQEIIEFAQEKDLPIYLLGK